METGVLRTGSMKRNYTCQKLDKHTAIKISFASTHCVSLVYDQGGRRLNYFLCRTNRTL